MKRVLLLFVSLIVIAIPAFADNALQREYEMKSNTSPSGNKESVKKMLKDDYSYYQNGGGSLYGVLKYQEQHLTDSKVLSDKLNLYYVNKMIKDYDCYIRFYDKEYCGIKPYIVGDISYRQLNDTVKDVMSGLNFMFGQL